MCRNHGGKGLVFILNTRARDAVVIGGGVIGSSIAYQLAKRGIDTMLLDRSGLCGGTSSSASVGVLMQTKTPGPKLALALESLEMYRGLSDELGADLEFDNGGSLIIAETNEEKEILKAKVKILLNHGVNAQFLDRRQTLQRQPQLADHIHGASYCVDDAAVSPLNLVHGFTQAASRLGARIRPYAEVRGLTVSNGRITEVVVEDGSGIPAGLVVIASGIWASDVAAMVGLSLPIVPQHGQILVTEPAPRFMQGMILAAKYLLSKAASPDHDRSALTAGLVAYQTQRGNVLVGSTRQFGLQDRAVTYAGMTALAESVASLLPITKSLSIIRAFAGLRPSTADGLPIIGRSSSIENLYIAAGHGGDGIALSPITGVRIAQLISGEIDAEVLAPFSPTRFALHAR